MKKISLAIALLLSVTHLFSQIDEKKLNIKPVDIFVGPVKPTGKVDCRCNDSIIGDGGFENLKVLVGGSDIITTSFPWKPGMATPQWSPTNGPCNKGVVSMWGNKVVGESIYQNLPAQLINNQTYTIRFTARLINVTNPATIVKLKAIFYNGGAPGSYNPSGPSNTSINMNTNWGTYTIDIMIPATGSYNSIVLHPENNFSVNDGATVSWIQLDNICIERTCKIPNEKCDPKFKVTPFTINSQGNIIINANPSVNAGAMHYWGVTGATGINDYTHIPLATILSGGTFGLGINSSGVVTPIGMGTGINASNSGYGYHYEGFALGSCFKITHYIKCCNKWYSQTKTYCVKLCTETKESEISEVLSSNVPNQLQ